MFVSSAYSAKAVADDYMSSSLVDDVGPTSSEVYESEGNLLLAHVNVIPPHVHYPPPVNPYCGYQRGSTCYTHQGNMCASYVLSYQPNWFSACISLGHGIFTFCTNTPTFQWPSLVFQQTCALRTDSLYVFFCKVFL